MTIALIDGDICAYRCAASAENESEDVAILRTDSLMRDILAETDSSEFRAFLSDSITFRNEIYPWYKANRVQPKPRHLKACKAFLVNEWKAESEEKLEADDLMGINQTKDTIICSIDKDLLQITGAHYNFVKKEFYNITDQSGRYSFWYQMLVGDRSDNIDGVKGIGPKTAQKILEGCLTEEQYFDTVRNVYGNDDLMYLFGRLLWILRKNRLQWQPIKELSLGMSPLPHEQEVL